MSDDKTPPLSPSSPYNDDTKLKPGDETQHMEDLESPGAKKDNADLTYVEDDGREVTVRMTKEDRRKAELRIKRKLDIRFLPMIIVIFILNYIDRNALTSARLKGLEQDLHLSTVQYEACLAILYAGYSPAQIPSNMFLNKVPRPSMYIASCVVLWGLTSALTGVAQNFIGMLFVRLFIGLPEAAFYCGAMYHLSRFYTRVELASRGAILYCGLLTSNAFGPLMAAGILSNMEGDRGIRAWRWLFYIEGCITILIGLIAFWVLPDNPHNTRWLSPGERMVARQRLAEDASEADADAPEDSMWEGLKMAIKDPKVPLFMVGTCSQLLGLSYTNFFPSLTATIFPDTTQSLLLTAPPWIFCAIVCYLNALHADKTGERFWHVTWPWYSTIISYIIAIATMNTAARYVSLFLMAVGYAGFALTLVFVSNAIPRPPAKRAAAMGLVNGFGNLGNLMGSFVWDAKYGPRYWQSMVVGIVTLVFAAILFWIIREMLRKENKRLDEAELGGATDANRQRLEEFARIEGITLQEAIERKRGFRYLY